MKIKQFTFLILTVLSISLLDAKTPVGQPSTYCSKAPSEKEIVHLEKKLIKLINQERAKQGLKELAVWDVLSKYAKEHSQNMAQGKVKVGHDGFHERAEGIKKLGKHVRSVGENVAYNYGMKDPLQAAVKGWMESPGHRKNILGNYDETGIGIDVAQDGHYYLTQLFSRKSK